MANNDDEKPLWEVQITVENICTRIRYEMHRLLNNRIRREEIRAIALGPNEFNSLRVEIMRAQQIASRFSRIPNAKGITFEGIPVYCSPRLGVQILLDDSWCFQVEEARRFQTGEGMDS